MAARSAEGKTGEGISTRQAPRGLGSLIVVDSVPATGVKAWVGLSGVEVGRRRPMTTPVSARAGIAVGVRDALRNWVTLAVVGVLLVAAALLAVLWHSSLSAVTVACVALAFVGVRGVALRPGVAGASDQSQSEGLIPVRRDGHLTELRAGDVVPGDVIILAPGRRVPADAMLIDSDDLVMEERTPSGGAALVEKRSDPDHFEGTPLAHRSTIVLASSVVREGYGTAIVLGV